MIEETLEELEKFNTEETPFEVAPLDNQNKLVALENNTIKEADEHDEEDTQFDKDGNRIRRSNHSMHESGHKTKHSMNDINFIPGDQLKYDIEEIPQDPKFAKTQEIDFDRVMSGENCSQESESVKVEEDLLNDSIKFDDNLL